MRFFVLPVFLFAVFLALLGGVSAVDQQKAVVFSYPQLTPDDVIARAKKEIEGAGGMITHEYKLFKGFAATAPQKILDTVTAWSTSQYAATVEEDQTVSVAGSGRH